MPSAEDLLFRSRASQIKGAKRQKLDEWFKGRQWRICTELSGPVEGGVCKDGQIILAAPAEFQTPLGNRGRRGYIVQEVDAAGNDLSTRPQIFGIQVLRETQELYGAIVNLPPKRPRGRPKSKGLT